MFEDIPNCPKCGNNFAKHDGKICDVRTCWDEDEVKTLKKVPELELIDRIEVYLDDDNIPVENIKDATSKYVTLFGGDDGIKEQYSVCIIDGVDQEYVNKKTTKKVRNSILKARLRTLGDNEDV